MWAGVKICSVFGQAGGGDVRSLLEGIAAVLIVRRVAPGKTLILGSGGGSTLVS